MTNESEHSDAKDVSSGLESDDFLAISATVDNMLAAETDDRVGIIRGCKVFIDAIETHHGPNEAWDSHRVRLAQIAAAWNLNNVVIELMHATHAPHRKVDALLYMHETPEYTRYLLEANLRNMPDTKRECLRALRDRLIRNRPNSDLISKLERQFAATSTIYSELIDWAESQAMEYPNTDWDEIISIAAMDESWGEVGLNERRHVLITLIRFEDEIGQVTDASMILIKDMLNKLRRGLASERALPIWDRLRERCMQTMLDIGWHDAAGAFVESISDTVKRARLRARLQDISDADDGGQ